MSAKQGIIEFKIERVDRIKAGVVSLEDENHGYLNMKRMIEQEAVLKAYNKGMIILAFEWENNSMEFAKFLFVTLGKVTWSEKP